ncbi:MAG: response regulator [Proteobacteria bacterium]|nr:response regulator [Pseudomonadota bacterium]
MSTTKEPLEITCTECSTRFRLWVPAEVLSTWSEGANVNCVSCGKGHKVTRLAEGFSVEDTAGVVTQPAPAPVATAPVAAPVAPAPAAAVPSAELDTVLFIEDDRLAREMIENSLQDVTVKMVVVKNSTEALKAVSTETVHLIVTDLYLKDPNDPEAVFDGEDFLKRVVDTGANIPAIITTGKDIIDDIVLDPKWFDMHVKGFIQKGNPFWVDELKLKIKEVLYKD